MMSNAHRRHIMTSMKEMMQNTQGTNAAQSSVAAAEADNRGYVQQKMHTIAAMHTKFERQNFNAHRQGSIRVVT